MTGVGGTVQNETISVALSRSGTIYMIIEIRNYDVLHVKSLKNHAPSKRVIERQCNYYMAVWFRSKSTHCRL